MRFLKFLLPLLLMLGVSVQAQSPTYGIGRTPTAEEIRAWDISIGPMGEELPPGRGSVGEGSQLYLERACAGCHGTTGMGGTAPRLVKRDASPDTSPWALGRVLPIRAPYATAVWDYINRGMPLYQEGTLSPDEVYALTAYLLFLNDVVDEGTVLDAQSLPLVQMPNRETWAPLPDWWKPGMPRLKGYPY